MYKVHSVVDFHFVTKHTFDRQVNRDTNRQKCLRNTMSCITCGHAIKTFSLMPTNMVKISAKYH